MRNLIYAINITLDGCCEHTKVGPPSEDMYEYHTQLLRDAGLLLYGRKTYQLMVPYWPEIAKSQAETKPENEFAKIFDSIDRLVFSRSLDSVEDEKTTIVHANLGNEVLRRKQEPGKPILVGGVDLPSQLAELGLIDEYRFVVAPIAVGEGRRVLEGLRERLQLKLVDSKIFKSGYVALRYLKQ